MYAARVRLPHSIELLLRSEVELVIEQANLGIFDSVVAKKYLIDQVPQVEIAEELGYERSTITKRMPRIIRRASSRNRVSGSPTQRIIPSRISSAPPK